MNLLHKNIEQACRKLKLSGLAQEWQTIEFQTKDQYLHDLLSLELKGRETNRINRLVKSALFPVYKTMDDFVWNQNIDIPQGITKEYIENCEFLDTRENLIFMGAVGTGKSHLATALAMKVCASGRSVRFFTAAGLANLLYEKNQKGSFHSFMKSLQKTELIVLDEVGFVPLHKDASELLFQVVSDCYERRSLIITSNLEFSHWNSIFGDKRLTAALVDRLVHHSHILVFSGESYRLTQSMKRVKRS